MAAQHGKQPGDPVEGAKAIGALACLESTPCERRFGSEAYEGVQEMFKQDGELDSGKYLRKIALSYTINN